VHGHKEIPNLNAIMSFYYKTIIDQLTVTYLR